MSDQHQVIEHNWSQRDPWAGLQRSIESSIKKKALVQVTGPVQVTATFSMLQDDNMWHTKEPGLDVLVHKLINCLHYSGLIKDINIVQLHIGKIVPGPKAQKTSPGVRISILALT